MRGLVVAAVLVATGCAGDSAAPEPSIPAALVGEWLAEPACVPPCEFTLAWTANPAARLNAVAALGVTVRVQVTSTGRFSRSGSGEAAEGRVRVEGESLIVKDTRNVVDTIDYRVEGTYLHLSFRREFVELDFNGDGQKDPAKVTGVFRKR